MLTDSQIKAAIRNAQPATLSDNNGTRGEGRLLLKIRPRTTGAPAATWLASHYVNGKRKLQTLGQYPALSLAAARKLQAKTTPKAEHAAGATLGDLCRGYLNTLRGRRSHRLADGILFELLQRIDPATPANQVTPEQIRAWLADVHTRGAALAARSRSVIHAAYAWAMKSEQSYTTTPGQRWAIPVNPVAQVAPDPNGRRAGQRTLTAAELVAVYRWAGQDKNPAARALVIQILTGCRVEEALSLHRDQIDRARGLITWEQTKNGKPHRLPILPGLAAVLDQIEPNEAGRLFGNPAKPAAPLRTTTLGKISGRCCRDLGLAHFAPRDLRRSWATNAADYAGIGFEARERVQGHTLPGVADRHYAHSATYEQIKRDALMKWEGFLLSKINGG